MTDFFAGLLSGVIRFYAWTIGIGIPVLLLISLIENAADLVREWRRGHERLDRAVPRHNT
jgi:cytochrome c biogenesis protein CcdA